MVQAQTQAEVDIQKVILDQVAVDKIVVTNQIDLSDQSFMLSFAGSSSQLSSIEQGLARFLERERALNAEHALQKGSSLVRELLSEIAATLPDLALREQFLKSDIADKDLLEVLHHTSSERRLEFLSALCDLSWDEPAVSKFLNDKFDNALHCCDSTDKAKLLNHLLQGDNRHESEQLIVTLLRSSDGLAQLCSIVNGQDRRLLALNNPEITEFVAHFRLDQKMRNIGMPEIIVGEISAQDLALVKAEFEAAMRRASYESNQDSKISETVTAQDFARIADGNLAELNLEWAKCSYDTERVELLNRLILKSTLEFRYGIRLTNSQGEKSVFGLVEGRAWSSAEISDLYQVFARIPEGKVLFTPLLTEIQRVPNLGRGVLAARYPDGVIRVADLAIEHPYISALYAGESSLQVTLTHELGHSIQIGMGFYGKDRSENPALSEADPLYDFDEFSDLSGWELVDSERYSVTNQGLSVVLDGCEIQLGYPVEHAGELRIYFLVGESLYGYNARAAFTIDPYSRATPWEDFAEAWCEYLLMPERLIYYAPEKFLFLEREFRVYEENSELWKYALSMRQSDG